MCYDLCCRVILGPRIQPLASRSRSQHPPWLGRKDHPRGSHAMTADMTAGLAVSSIQD
jgi:hypothetical protein